MNKLNVENNYVTLENFGKYEPMSLTEEIETTYEELINNENILFKEGGLARHEIDVKNSLPEYIDNYVIYKSKNKGKDGSDVKFIFPVRKSNKEFIKSLYEDISNYFIHTGMYSEGAYYVDYDIFSHVHVTDDHCMCSYNFERILKPDEDLVLPSFDQKPEKVRYVE